MRVGFVTSILWSRYGPFWTRLAADAGAEVVLPDPEQVLALQAKPQFQQVPSAAFRLATAEAVALADCDMVVAPHPNRDSPSRRGSGQDPWASEFPEVLATTFGLTNVFGVPVVLNAGAEQLAIAFLQRLLHDGWRNRMIMERHRNRLQATPGPLPPRTRPGTTGVVGQPWLAGNALAGLAVPEARHVAAGALDPQMLRDEGARKASGLSDTDLEVLGAVSWFSRRGDFERITFIQDEGNEHDGWLLRQAREATHKPLEAVAVQQLLPEEDLARMLLEQAKGS